MPEMEGKGLDYERYALKRLFHGLVRRHAIRSVLEIPAKGEKAMPSIYSLAFGQAGCAVSLVNGEPRSRGAWERLGYPVTWLDCPDLRQTGLPSAAYDLVWNFMVLPQYAERDALVREMTRLSRRWLLFVAVNRFNPGFFSHRMVHRLSGVPWTHGDVRFMSVYHTRRYLERQGLRVVRLGAVDTPPYPDSLGFRDMRLHRMNVDLNQIEWDSRTLSWMKDERYPPKLHLLYLAERLPLPLPLKLLYAHLFWVLVEK
jgi:hypothetical protein